MSEIDLRKLERQTFDRRGQRSERELTIDALGKILLLVWQADPKNSGRQLPSRNQLTKAILATTGMPTTVKSIVEIENRIDGPIVDSLTALMVAAQQAGIAHRVNPENKAILPATTTAQARHLLQDYLRGFHDEVEWVRKMLEKADNTVS